MKLLPRVADAKRLPHLQLARLRRRCDDPEGAADEILEQFWRCLDYGATPRQVNSITGHWPRAEES